MSMKLETVPNPAPDTAARRDAIVAALRTVYDPEIPVNIYDLGLVYTIDEPEPGVVSIDMTLTAPGCPVAGILPGQAAQAVQSIAGVDRCDVHLVWDPPWTRERMSDEAKLELDLM